MDLVVRRADSGIEDTKSIPMVDFAADRVPAEYLPALFIVGVAIVALLLLVLPGPRAIALVELRVASKLRPMKPRALLGVLGGSGRREKILSALLSAFIAAFALAPRSFGSEVDGLVVLAVTVSLLVAARVAPARRLAGVLRVLVEVGACVAVLVLTLGVVFAHAGTLSLADLVRAQGALPWEFAATRNPASALLAVAYAAAIVVALRVRPNEAAAARGGVAERLTVLLASALAAAVFFGGFAIPGAGEARTSAQALLGAALFVAKTWTFAAFVWGASSALGSVAPGGARRFAFRRLLPLVVAAAVIVAVLRYRMPSAGVESVFGATTVALAVLLFVRSLGRVRAALVRPEPHANPFL